MGRDKELMEMFPNAKCFGKSKDGSPIHPFANWIAEQEYNYDFDSVSGHVWYKKNHMGVYSTNQLYQLFKTRNK